MQGLTLLVGPRMIVALLLDEARSESCTINSKNPPNVNRLANSLKVIEVYFARCLGMSLLTIAVLTVMLTGSIPLNATIAEPVSTDESDPKAPYALPTLMVTSVFHAASAFYVYTWYVTGGQGAFALAVLGNSILASIGLWCLLFATSNGRISRRTGADKRTTGFPFANSEAAKKHAGKKGL